jgi:uncharacterized membrane protein
MSNAPVVISIAPNCSLTLRSAAWFFAGIAFVTLAVAMFFTAQGFWPVLPFAGLELALLGWALWNSMQRRFRRQDICIAESEVAVEDFDRKFRSQLVFPRHWAQVKMRAGFSPLAASRLTIEAHGRSCEIGSFLNEQERRGLSQRLARLIGRINESPALPSQGL